MHGVTRMTLETCRQSAKGASAARIVGAWPCYPRVVVRRSLVLGLVACGPTVGDGDGGVADDGSSSGAAQTTGSATADAGDGAEATSATGTTDTGVDATGSSSGDELEDLPPEAVGGWLCTGWEDPLFVNLMIDAEMIWSGSLCAPEISSTDDPLGWTNCAELYQHGEVLEQRIVRLDGSRAESPIPVEQGATQDAGHGGGRTLGLVGDAHAENAPPAAAAPPSAAPQPEVTVVDQDAPYFEACAREGLNQSECVGRLIWFKATAGNDRFHTYTFQQRIGVLVDWFRVLRADQRDDRFWAWGIINDPSCCKPGDPDCPAKSADETYGFDWCPGDDVLLKYVGKPGYVDPACGLKDALLDPDDPHSQGGKTDQRHSACDLKFGTSTGALGIRKFPNPRFDAAKWKALNGGNGTWAGFAATKAATTGIESDTRVSKLADASVEPPFLIGTSCGSCHIAFDPLNPPADPARPAWENIKGLIGNQYTRVSEIMVSGMASNTLEWQMFAHARPGTSDTSAIPTDQVNNPGTINALINLAKRPTFANESVIKWRKTASCAKGVDETRCWCEPGRNGKCWEKSLHKEAVHHILKGGEDSIGALEAIQRVYFNIGSCSEQCWVNNFTDMRQLDPEQRGSEDPPYVAYRCQLSFPTIDSSSDPPHIGAGTQNDGVHRVVAGAPVFIAVYGWDAFVSYAYAGGTELREIAPPQ